MKLTTIVALATTLAACSGSGGHGHKDKQLSPGSGDGTEVVVVTVPSVAPVAVSWEGDPATWLLVGITGLALSLVRRRN